MSDKEPSTFDYLKSICQTKDNIFSSEKSYQPFAINRFLSSSIDTVYYANEMNRRYHLGKKLQYDYLRNIIRKKYRKLTWMKPEKVESLKDIKAYYQCNTNKALEILKILKPEDIEYITKFNKENPNLIE